VVAALSVMTMLLLGCSSAQDAVDQAAGSETRYVAADSMITKVSAAHRTSATHVLGQFTDGRSFKLSDMRGDVVVFNFWASWCPPCRAEAKDLEQVSQQTSSLGVRFVGVNVKDHRDSALAFQHTFGIRYPTLFDPSNRVALQLGGAPLNTLPSTVVIDREGRIAATIGKSMRAVELAPIVRQVAAEPRLNKRG